MLEPARVIQTLRRLEATQPTVYGADSHHFRLNPPLSEPKVAAFEQDHAITLPSDFRTFLTQIGNGGAGPCYGIFPLGEIDDGWSLQGWRENDHFVGVLSEPFLLEEKWNDVSRMPLSELAEQHNPECEKQWESFTEEYWGTKLMNGALPICHEGCAIRIWLVVTGMQAGTLWVDRRSEFQGLHPLKMSDGSPATFGRWYDEWLKRCEALADDVQVPGAPS